MGLQSKRRKADHAPSVPVGPCYILCHTHTLLLLAFMWQLCALFPPFSVPLLLCRYFSEKMKRRNDISLNI